MLISFVGMKQQEVAVKPHVVVVLHPDSEILDEVVVTGYGNFKKASFTGAASTVNTGNLENVPVISVEENCLVAYRVYHSARLPVTRVL